MKKDENYTYRSMRDEREYGLYWYSGLWHILRPILVGLTVFVLVVGIGVTVWNKLYGSFLAPVDEADAAEYSFEISSGDSLNRVASNLEAAGLIRSKTVFKYYCDFAGMAQKIQTGTYSLRKAMAMTEIADRLTTGDGNPIVRNITLIPGETVEDFAAKLVRDGVLEKADEFLAACRDGKAFSDYYYIDDVLKSGHPEQRKYVLEGYLAPNTYEVYVTATAEEIIRKLLSQTEAAFPAELQGIAADHGPDADAGEPDRKGSEGNRLCPGQRGVPQPSEGGHEAGQRCHDPLYYRREENGAGGQRSDSQQPLQYLPGQRTAGRSDLQSFHGGDPGGPVSGRNDDRGEVSVLLRQGTGERRAVLLQDPGSAPPRGGSLRAEMAEV